MNRTGIDADLGPLLTTPPRNFSDILGRENAVDGLRKRLRSRRHSTGVILYGPTDVGKRTLSRLYAKALLCEGDFDDVEPPCNGCSACRSFEQQGSFGLIELDAAADNAVHNVRRLVKDARYVPFAKHRICVIRNVDDCAPQTVDALLKTLEEAPQETTFVLLARSLDGIRLAGQSRCATYRLGGLSADQSRALCTALLRTFDVYCDESVIDVLVANCRGLFGRLQRDCAKVAALEAITLEAAKGILGLDWVQQVISYLGEIFADEEPVPDTLALLKDVAPNEACMRVQVILEHILHVHDDPTARTPMTHAALMHVDPARLTQLVHLLQARAAGLGMPSKELWQALATHWLKADHSDPAGFLDATLEAWRIVQRVPARNSGSPR